MPTDFIQRLSGIAFMEHQYMRVTVALTDRVTGDKYVFMYKPESLRWGYNNVAIIEKAKADLAAVWKGN